MKSMGKYIGGRIIVIDGRGGNSIFGFIRFFLFGGFCWSIGLMSDVNSLFVCRVFLLTV